MRDLGSEFFRLVATAITACAKRTGAAMSMGDLAAVTCARQRQAFMRMRTRTRMHTRTHTAHVSLLVCNGLVLPSGCGAGHRALGMPLNSGVAFFLFAFKKHFYSHFLCRH